MAAPATAIAAPEPIAVLQGQSSVRAWNGVQVWTDYSTIDKRWHVVVRRAGQIMIPAAIASGDGRLKVDVGPGPGGEPLLAFVSCTDVCQVVVSDLDGGRAQPLPGSAGASSVSIYGSRVAWVQDNHTVLIRRLGTSQTKRLAGAPTRTCYVPFPQRIRGKKVIYPRRCARARGASVDDLELDGSRLALIDSFPGVSSGGRVTEVRMQSVVRGPQRLVALMNSGEGVQRWIGPSWAR